MHEELQRRMQKKGAHIDGVYFCPHHPNATLEQYRKNCSCRKPEPGMILRAATRAQRRRESERNDWRHDAGRNGWRPRRHPHHLVRTGLGGRDHGNTIAFLIGHQESAGGRAAVAES